MGAAQAMARAWCKSYLSPSVRGVGVDYAVTPWSAGGAQCLWLQRPLPQLQGGGLGAGNSRQVKGGMHDCRLK